MGREQKEAHLWVDSDLFQAREALRKKAMRDRINRFCNPHISENNRIMGFYLLRRRNE